MQWMEEVRSFLDMASGDTFMSNEEVAAWNIVEKMALNSSSGFNSRDLPTKNIPSVMEVEHNTGNIMAQSELSIDDLIHLHMAAISHQCKLCIGNPLQGNMGKLIWFIPILKLMMLILLDSTTNRITHKFLLTI